MDRPVLHAFVRELVEHERLAELAEALPTRARVSEPALPLLLATLHERLLPGEGDFDLRALLGTLADIDAVAPIGVEVFSDALHALGPTEAARRAANAARHILERA